MDVKNILNAEQAAKHVGISKQWAFMLIKSGEWPKPVAEMGRIKLYSVKSLEPLKKRYTKSQEIQSNTLKTPSPHS